MEYIGIDIGSTAAKIYTIHNEEPLFFTVPTGWSSKETAAEIEKSLRLKGIEVRDKENFRTVSTGYGREVVDYADKAVTEITCHGKGGSFLCGGDCTIVDVGGQDTKMITVENGMVVDFLMNDKCAAGTGKFLELMANRLNVTIPELFLLAESGKVLPISALCTVFAESEVVSLIGQGNPREDIAAGVVDSVATKVYGLTQKRSISAKVVLTGGLSQTAFFGKALSQKLGLEVIVPENGLYAGAIGAMLCARGRKK